MQVSPAAMDEASSRLPIPDHQLLIPGPWMRASIRVLEFGPLSPASSVWAVKFRALNLESGKRRNKEMEILIAWLALSAGFVMGAAWKGLSVSRARERTPVDSDEIPTVAQRLPEWEQARPEAPHRHAS